MAATITLGSLFFTLQMLQWEVIDPLKYACYFLLCVLGSGMRIKLPGVSGTMSAFFLFVLLGVIDLSLPEALLMGCCATLIQCVWRVARKPRAVQILFNLASMSTAITVSKCVYDLLAEHNVPFGFRLPVLALALFICNTLPVAVAIGLTEKRNVRKVWSECYFWSFPYYMVGAAVAGIFVAIDHFAGWPVALLVFPLVYALYRFYGMYLGRLATEKQHSDQMAALHLRTIEALALAIEGKDQNAHSHLHRVQIYAVAIGQELNLSATELAALRAAALLHDIGKLAIPEHIVSKPGKLTPEEFEKMKIHTIVGAEILEHVDFPYPVVPIVRAHHEKWDGTGYPQGLQGEAIPIGARILAAVDCLDALASERQYRAAIPLAEAMQCVTAESGKSFDPSVVQVLQNRYLELEKFAQLRQVRNTRLSNAEVSDAMARSGVVAEEKPRSAEVAESSNFLQAIAAARQEVQDLFELTQDLGNSLSMDETLAVLAGRLQRMIPHDCLALYVRKDDALLPVYTNGEDSRLFSSLTIPVGQGLSGWVVETKKPIINGNPAAESISLDPSKRTRMRSGISVPLECANGALGALTLYNASASAFTADHLRILLAISSKLALSVENALKYQQAESFATTDYLTSLPNARSLFMHLDREIARAKRESSPLAVLVCDLDGFKGVNDRFGHLEGNKVLQLVAAGIKDSCRSYDYVARMGGDEFVLVVPGLSAEAIREKIVTLARTASNAGYEVCGTRQLSMSVGVAHYPKDGRDVEDLLSNADQRMYNTKQENKAGVHPLHYPMELAATAGAQ